MNEIPQKPSEKVMTIKRLDPKLSIKRILRIMSTLVSLSTLNIMEMQLRVKYAKLTSFEELLEGN